VFLRSSPPSFFLMKTLIFLALFPMDGQLEFDHYPITRFERHKITLISKFGNHRITKRQSDIPLSVVHITTKNIFNQTLGNENIVFPTPDEL
jgi:hypothetical protein